MLRKSTFILGLLFSLLSWQAVAQIKFTAKANKYVVGQNENFTIEFKINEKGSSFKAPDLSDFVVLSGPNPSQYSSYSNVSGRTFSLSYSYQLRPRRQGTFTIPSASIKAAGSTFKTEPMTIKVVPQAAKPKNPNDPESIAAAGAFFKVITNKTSLYRGEPLVASYKLYTKLQVGSPQVRKEPPLSGFYKEVVDLGRVTTQSERYQNENFNTGIIRQLVLVPQKTGVLRPGDVEMVIPTLVQLGRDRFGFRRQQQVNQVAVESFPAITVKPLPSAGKPSNFSGAVGDYTFNVTCSKTELSADESITFTVEVKGKGNVKLISLPKPEFPAAFEAYDPKYKENIKVSINGMRGNKSNEYLLVPRYGGTYKIPAMEFSFFDVDRGQYETIRSQEFEITVDGAAPASGSSAGAVVNREKEGVTFLGKDILTLKQDLELRKKSTPFFGSSLFYGLLLGGLGLAVLLIAIGVYLKNRTVDYTAQRQTKASKKARKRLALAKKELDANNTDGFYEALANALWGYFSDKLNIAPSKLSKEFIGESLKGKGADEQSVDRVLAMLNQAEMARYSQQSSQNPKQDYEEAALLITKIDAQL